MNYFGYRTEQIPESSTFETHASEPNIENPRQKIIQENIANNKILLTFHFIWHQSTHSQTRKIVFPDTRHDNRQIYSILHIEFSIRSTIDAVQIFDKIINKQPLELKSKKQNNHYCTLSYFHNLKYVKKNKNKSYSNIEI